MRIKREKGGKSRLRRFSIAAAVGRRRLFLFDLFPSPLSLSLASVPAPSLLAAAGTRSRFSFFLKKKRNLRKNFTGLPAGLQRLSFAGRPVSCAEDSSSLALLGVTDDSTLHCSLALLGGGKKRKKKTYTKPKKQKHKHRKVKLGVLKFFKVDDGGKVERLRQACPQCGPATFMAKHFDRVYCGKCHVTYMVEGGAAGAGGKGKKK